MYNNTSYFYDLFDSRWHSSMTQQPLLQVVVLCGQEAHEREAYSSWYWPRSHVTHGSSPSSEKDPGRHWAVGQRGVGWRGTFITILYIISFLFHFRRNCVMVIIMKKYSVAVLPILGWEQSLLWTTSKYNKYWTLIQVGTHLYSPDHSWHC